MARVTRSDLEKILREVSRVQGRPIGAMVQVRPQRWDFQVGALKLDHNGISGGWDLVEIISATGGEDSLVGNSFAGRGRLKAHEMETFLLGMLAALERPVRQPERKAVAR